MSTAAILTLAVLPVSFMLFILKPRSWLPVYLILLAAAPQVDIGGIPVCASTSSLVGAMTAICLSKLLRCDSKIVSFAPLSLTVPFLLSLLASVLTAFLLWGDRLGVLSFLKFVRAAEAFAPMFLLAVTYQMVDKVYVRRLTHVVLAAGILASVTAVLSCFLPDMFRSLAGACDSGFTLFVGSAKLWRAIGVFGDPNHLSSFLACVLVLSVMLTQLPESYAARWFCRMAGVFCLFAMLLSFSRAGWINATVSGFVCLGLMPHVSSFRKIRAVAAAALSIAVAICAFARFNNGLYRFIVERVSSTLFAIMLGDVNSAFSGRLSIWSTVAEVTHKYPFFGIGYKMLPERFTAADNSYLAFLAEGGLIGAAIWVAWLAYVTASAVRVTSRHPLGVYVLAVWIGLLVNMLSADVMTYWRTMGLYFSVLAVVVLASRNSRWRDSVNRSGHPGSAEQSTRSD